MSSQYTNEPLLDMFIFETSQLLEQLETHILNTERNAYYTDETINEIFRIMHTIKGSSAMMSYDNISTLAHLMEDIFFFLREEQAKDINYSALSDLVLADVDFIKGQIKEITEGKETDDDVSKLIEDNKNFLLELKGNTASSSINIKTDILEPIHINKSNHSCRNTFKAVIYFQEDCAMENIRAFNVVHNLEDIAGEINYVPEDIMNSESAEIIKRDGFSVVIKTDYSYVDVHQLLMQTVFLKELSLEEISQTDITKGVQESTEEKRTINVEQKEKNSSSQQQNITQQSIISVTVSKLDKLMDLMGEFVISEAMVTQNPDLKGLQLDNFHKAARQLNKITSELQDIVMSIRMVPLSATFHKMNRIVRDMCKKLDKNVVLEIIGEDTEVDKNIIEHISDPLMHLVRNAVDHGIELKEERERCGKSNSGTLTLEAKNAGRDVLILVKDDGKGLDKNIILEKAKKQGLLNKPENEMSDQEIYNLILVPGFSTNDKATEFSGRGVGMDVVVKNIENVGGSVSIYSEKGSGTIITIKIPLTLAIIDGMNISVGNSVYTIPTTCIIESFQAKMSDIIIDPDNNEMIMVRGVCYPLLRLYEVFGIETPITDLSDGIFIMVEQDEHMFCLFVDHMLGQQQIVVKALPEYIRNGRRSKGLAGCTLLGDGNISLILDIPGLISYIA